MIKFGKRKKEILYEIYNLQLYFEKRIQKIEEAANENDDDDERKKERKKERVLPCDIHMFELVSITTINIRN